MRNWQLGHYSLFILVVVVIGLGVLFFQNTSELNALRALVTEKDTPPTSLPTPVDNPVSPHQQHIDKLESDAGIPLSRIAKLIIRDEGVRTKPYLDSQGVVTIGIGRSLQTNGVSVMELHALNATPNYRKVLDTTEVRNGRILIKTLKDAQEIFTRPLDKHDLELLLTDDLRVAKDDAVKVFGADWQKIDAVRQEAILEVAYNLGLTHFKGFHNFIASVKAQDWQKAASDLLLSEAARQNVTRYHRSAAVIQTGNPKYFELE